MIPEADAETQKTAADLDAIMRKYDRESNVRIWEGKPKIFVGIILAWGWWSLWVI